MVDGYSVASQETFWHLGFTNECRPRQSAVQILLGRSVGARALGGSYAPTTISAPLPSLVIDTHRFLKRHAALFTFCDIADHFVTRSERMRTGRQCTKTAFEFWRFLLGSNGILRPSETHTHIGVVFQLLSGDRGGRRCVDGVVWPLFSYDPCKKTARGWWWASPTR